MADEGKLKRVMKGREYFYVEAEAKGGGVVAGSKQLNPWQPIKFRANEPCEARYEKWGIHEPLVWYLLYGRFI